MKKNYLLAGLCFFFSHVLYAQAVKLTKNELETVNVSMSVEKLGDKEVVKVIMDTTIKKADQST